MGRAWVSFVFQNFLVPVAFFVVFRAQGAKSAIALAVAITLIQVLIQKLRRIPLSPFFLVASLFTIVFGMVDLLLTSPRFFRLQPFLQNFLIGLVFLVTLFRGKPLVEWFAASLPESVKPKEGELDRGYLRNTTWAWTIYFFAKAFLFLWLAYTVDLGELVLLRSLIGGLSLVAMFGAEVFYRKVVRPRFRTKAA